MLTYLTLPRVLVAFSLIVSGVLLFLALGWYPIAIVNGDPISARTFRNYTTAALTYQETAFVTYTPTSTPLIEASRQGEEALGAVALDELIEQRLILQGAQELIGESAPQLVEDKIREYQENPELIGASNTLFQLTPDELSRAVLAPEARRELLRGRLFLDGTELENWVVGRRANANVRIFSRSYAWDLGKVVMKTK